MFKPEKGVQVLYGLQSMYLWVIKLHSSNNKDDYSIVSLIRRQTQQMHRNTQKTTLHNQSFCQWRREIYLDPFHLPKSHACFAAMQSVRNSSLQVDMGVGTLPQENPPAAHSFSHSSERRNSGLGFRNPIVTSQLVQRFTDECVCLEMCIFRFNVGM